MSILTVLLLITETCILAPAWWQKFEWPDISEDGESVGAIRRECIPRNFGGRQAEDSPSAQK